MRLANLVVTHSLQLNNRCLRYLADCDVRGHAAIGVETNELKPDASVYAESLLTRDVRRLCSLWRWYRAASAGDALLERHVEEVEEVAAALADAPAKIRLALRLASIAPDDERAQARATLGDLFRPELRLVLVIAVSIAVLQQITGINSVFFYAPMIFERSGVRAQPLTPLMISSLSRSSME